VRKGNGEKIGFALEAALRIYLQHTSNDGLGWKQNVGSVEIEK